MEVPTIGSCVWRRVDGTKVVVRARCLGEPGSVAVAVTDSCRFRLGEAGAWS